MAHPLPRRIPETRTSLPSFLRMLLSSEQKNINERERHRYITTRLTTLVRSTLDALPKDIHFLSHKLLHLRICNTWLEWQLNYSWSSKVVPTKLTMVTSSTSKVWGFTIPKSLWNSIEWSNALRISLALCLSRVLADIASEVWARRGRTCTHDIDRHCREVGVHACKADCRVYTKLAEEETHERTVRSRLGRGNFLKGLVESVMPHTRLSYLIQFIYIHCTDLALSSRFSSRSVRQSTYSRRISPTTKGNSSERLPVVSLCHQW